MFTDREWLAKILKLRTPLLILILLETALILFEVAIVNFIAYPPHVDEGHMAFYELERSPSLEAELHLRKVIRQAMSREILFWSVVFGLGALNTLAIIIVGKEIKRSLTDGKGNS